MVLDAVRQQGQRIWQALSVADRQRFLRHLRHYWDVHRYRVAPQVAEVLEARQRTGSLQVQAARLLSISGEGETLRLTLARRGGGVQTLSVDHLILTTGPAHRALTDSQPFLQDLARRGLIRADALGMGRRWTAVPGQWLSRTLRRCRCWWPVRPPAGVLAN